MKCFFVSIVALGSVLTGMSAVEATVLFEENFDSYSPGKYIGAIDGWEPFHSAIDHHHEWIVTDAQSVSAPHSLHVYGQHDGCKSGKVQKPIAAGDHVLLRAKLRAAGEAGGGCHNDDISIGLQYYNGNVPTPYGYG